MDEAWKRAEAGYRYARLRYNLEGTWEVLPMAGRIAWFVAAMHCQGVPMNPMPPYFPKRTPTLVGLDAIKLDG
jgi:hypothetical protein